MSKKMNQTELEAHCDNAVTILKALLVEFSKSANEKMTKRAMLLAYWVRTYVKYIRDEDRFSPQSVFRLKRGAIVSVEFGYRVGRELGGRHYAVVIDADNSMYRNTVTVVPLGSLKENSKDDEHNVLLADGVYGPVRRKLDALIEDAKRTADEAVAMDSEIEATTAPEQRAVLRAVQRQKIDSTQKLIDQANAWIKEISHLKAGSVAKVDQLTTISKMRILQPLQKTHPLYGVRLSAQDLDKIDAQLMRLYFPNRKNDA